MAFVSAAISCSIPLRTGRFQAEKEWPGPPSARDMSGDLGQTAVPGTLIFIAGLGSSHNMLSALPLAKQTSSGLYALGLCNWVGFSAFNLGRDLPQAATAGEAEADRRTRRAGHIDRDHEPAVLRMDAGVSQSALVQGLAGSNHGPSPHHRNRRRVLPLSQNPGGATEKESIVAADGVASTWLVQRKGLKRRPFLCTPSRLEP